jgi:hypothetical protein
MAAITARATREDLSFIGNVLLTDVGQMKIRRQRKMRNIRCDAHVREKGVLLKGMLRR